MTFLTTEAHCLDDDFEAEIKREYGVTIKDQSGAPSEVVFEGDREQLIAMYRDRWGTEFLDEILDPMSTALSDEYVPASERTVHEYAFDLKLTTSLRVKAVSEKHARELLCNLLTPADANLGCWPNGSPILAEVSMDGNPSLLEIDGIPIDAIDSSKSQAAVPK